MNDKIGDICMNSVQISNVSMHFNTNKQKMNSLKEYFIGLIKRQVDYSKFIALNDISLNIEKGSVVGIVGLNGSGKSTLLKIIAGVLKPTKGKIIVTGVIAPLIELGAGFDMELTARENIYLNGAVLGFSKKMIQSKFEDIVDFSEVREFIDVPMKNYSSGMVARIAFAIATIVNPDILIVDEILSVGDFQFQKKCEDRISEMMKNNTTVIIVSHSIEQIERLCKRVIWIEKGILKMNDSTDIVCEAYKNS